VRRQREDLDRLLDRLVAGEEPEAAGDLAPLLHPARVARAALAVQVPPTVAAAHLAALRRDRARGLVATPAFPRPRLGLARVALVAATVLALGCSSVVAASARTLPGEPLYGVKRAVERLSVAMHRDPASRAALRLELAGRRLQEIQSLLAAGRSADPVLDDLERELAAAERDAVAAAGRGRDAAALLAHVEEMIAKHIAVLRGVLERVPAQAQDAIERAIEKAEKAKENVQHGRSQEGGRPASPGKPTSPGRSDGAPGRSGSAPGHR
jgi:hypothetical protein